jgi:hypothetical protein
LRFKDYILPRHRIRSRRSERVANVLAETFHRRPFPHRILLDFQWTPALGIPSAMDTPESINVQVKQ